MTWVSTSKSDPFALLRKYNNSLSEERPFPSAMLLAIETAAVLS